MIGVIVAAHGNIASAIVSTAESIMGKQSDFEAVDILISDHESEIVKKLKIAFDKLSSDQGILVLVELYGSSACNRCLSFCEDHSETREIAVVSGFNLPMIFKVITYRNQLNLNDLAERACDGGRSGVINVSKRG